MTKIEHACLSYDIDFLYNMDQIQSVNIDKNVLRFRKSLFG